VWGKVVFEVIRKNALPSKAFYYDEKNNLVRTMVFSDYRQFTDRIAPARMRLQPENKPGEFTELQYVEMAFDIPIDPAFFSLQQLKNF
jgi:hypothetical protein